MPDITRNLAIVVGIDKYLHVPNLTSACNDAVRLAEILKDKQTYQYDVLKVLDEQATYQHFIDLIENLNQGRLRLEDELVTLDKNHRLLFYFAGHGIADDASEQEERPEGFLVPQDAELKADNSKLLPMGLLHDALVNSPCRHLLIILDCCFAGSFRWAGLHRNAIRFESTKVYLERYQRFIEKRAQQVITSAAYNQKALDSIYRFGKRDDEVGGHSPFAELLFKVLTTRADRNLSRGDDRYLAAIAEDGVVTATELYAYLREGLYKKLSKGLGKAAERQTPGFCQLRGHAEGEFIFPLPGFKEASLATAEKLSEKRNPYKGLNSFEVSDSQLFFGRKTLTEELSRVVDAQPLTVVLAASGSGKSSLVKAGLIPHLTLEKVWQILEPIRPGESPLGGLNGALAQMGLLPIYQSGQPTEPEQQDLATSVATWSSNHPESKLLLVIDQFEELVTLCRNDQEREQFLQTLISALEKHPKQFRVVLTLRSDFEPQIRQNIEPYLAKELMSSTEASGLDWVKARFIVPAMTREELREVVEEPAAARVVFFESAKLVDRLIEEVANMPGALPLLSFALSELFLISLRSGRNDRTITWKDYEDLGGVTRSLTEKAEQEYRILTEEYKIPESIIRIVMLRMVAESLGELTRKRIPISELEYPESKKSWVEQVRDCFVSARLLVKGSNLEYRRESPTLEAVDEQYIEPAHDALIRAWTRLREWKESSQEDWLLLQLLTPAAKEWVNRDRPSSLLITDTSRLDQIKQIFDSENNWFNLLETEFVSETLNLNTATHLATQSDLTSNRSDVSPTITALLALESLLKHETSLGKLALRRSLALFPKSSISISPTDCSVGILLTSVSSNGQHFALLCNDLAVRVFHKDGHEVARLIHESDVAHLSYSYQGRYLISVSNPHVAVTIQIWDATNYHLLKRLDFSSRLSYKHSDKYGYQFAIAISQDENYIALALGENVQVWDLNSYQCIANFAANSQELSELQFSASSKRLTVRSDENIYVWSLESKELLSVIQAKQRERLLINNEGNKIFVCNEGGLEVWNLDNKQPSIELFFENVVSFFFSPDGKFLVTVKWLKEFKIREDVYLKIFSVQNLEEITTIRFDVDDIAGGRKWNLLFNPDSSCILLTGKIIHIWQLNRGEELASKPSNDEFCLDCSASQQYFLTVNRDGNNFNFYQWWAEDILADAEIKIKRNFTLSEWKTYFGDKPYHKTCTHLPPGSFNLGRDMAREGKIEEAIALFQEAQILDPELNLDIEQEVSRARVPVLIEHSRELAQAGDLQGSIANLEEIHQLAPDFDIHQLTLEMGKLAAPVLVQQGRDLASAYDPNIEEAISKFKQAQQYSPTIVNIDEELAKLAIPKLLERGKHLVAGTYSMDKAGAISKFEAALKLDPTLNIDPEQEVTKLMVDTLLREGERLAQQYEPKLEAVTSSFQEALNLDPSLSFNPEEKAGKLVAPKLVEQGRKLAREGRFVEAITKLQNALKLDPSLELDPQAEIAALMASKQLEQGKALTRVGNIKASIGLYVVAEAIAPSEVSASALNSLCWFGSLEGHADDVMFACERAVELEPNNASWIDSRGLARAMTGNFEGAIADFEFFVAQTSNDKDKEQRQQWVEKLRSGENPFTEEEINKMKYPTLIAQQ